MVVKNIVSVVNLKMLQSALLRVKKGFVQYSISQNLINENFSNSAQQPFIIANLSTNTTPKTYPV